uniref:Thioesterase domain-containing protein n=1 Tax=Tetradesmus obliquus TaxID=3088 RepID=A0A383VQN5_TETOB|eukprot:jgi/Sobl393_1/11626/SZX67044.1
MLARCGAMGLQLCSSQIGSLVAALPSACTLLRRYGNEAAKDGIQWHWMVSQGHKINPCNSMLHPAVKEAGILPEDGEEIAVQVAYTPKSHCFGCGPAHPDGLHLESKRIEHGLEARVSLPAKYCAFPGILNGGILSTLLDCHGNWTAAIALMDRSCLPKPPLTLTASMLVSYKEPSPPDTELIVRSHVVAVRENQNPGLGKAAVEVDVAVLLPQADGSEKLLVQGTGIFKRLGALRAL